MPVAQQFPPFKGQVVCPIREGGQLPARGFRGLGTRIQV